MTIHRIFNDDSYYTFVIPTREVLDKLGREYPFHIDRSPVPYSEVWKEPLFLDFGPENGETKHEIVPDLAARNGRLFFNEKAYTLLGADLKQDGEFLPVTYDGGTGHIFNPLTIAEEFGAVDENVTMYNDYGEVQSLGFLEEKLPIGTMVFRSEATKYAGVFCTDQLKKAIEDAGLVGVCFHPDLAGIGGGITIEH